MKEKNRKTERRKEIHIVTERKKDNETDTLIYRGTNETKNVAKKLFLGSWLLNLILAVIMQCYNICSILLLSHAKPNNSILAA